MAETYQFTVIIQSWVIYSRLNNFIVLHNRQIPVIILDQLLLHHFILLLEGRGSLGFLSRYRNFIAHQLRLAWYLCLVVARTKSHLELRIFIEDVYLVEVTHELRVVWIRAFLFRFLRCDHCAFIFHFNAHRLHRFAIIARHDVVLGVLILRQRLAAFGTTFLEAKMGVLSGFQNLLVLQRFIDSPLTNIMLTVWSQRRVFALLIHGITIGQKRSSVLVIICWLFIHHLLCNNN